MLTIRLFRTGRRNQPSFKIVVTDKLRSSTRGRFVEEVGIYNPLTKQRNLKGDRVKYWISVGAKPSDTVHNMLVADKVIEGQKLPKHKKSKKPVAETPAPAANPPEADKQAGPPQSGEASLGGEPQKPTEAAPAEEPKPEENPQA